MEILHESENLGCGVGSVGDAGWRIGTAGQEIALAAGLLDSYVGVYELDPDFRITVTRGGDALFGQATGQPRFRLYAESGTEFFLKEVDAQITFVRGSGGKAAELVLHQEGRDMPGRRVAK